MRRAIGVARFARRGPSGKSRVFIMSMMTSAVLRGMRARWASARQSLVNRSSAHSTDWLTFDRGARIFNRMVEQRKSAALDAVFHALADGTRRSMLERLA